MPEQDNNLKNNNSFEVHEETHTSRRKAIGGAIALTASALIGSSLLNKAASQTTTDSTTNNNSQRALTETEPPTAKDGKGSNESIDGHYNVKSPTSGVKTSDIEANINSFDGRNEANFLKPTGLSLDKETSDLQTRLKKINDAITIDNDGNLSLGSSSGLKNTPFTFNKLESVITVLPANILWKSFSPQKVENLLNEAIDLLQRGIRDRTEWDEKALVFFNQIIELQEFFKLDENLQKQEKEGYYEQDYNKVLNELDVEKNNQMKYTNALTKITALINGKFNQNSIDIQQNALRRMNFAAYAYSGFFSDSRNNDPGWHNATFGTEDKRIWEHVVLGSLTINEFNLGVQKSIYEIQKESLELNASASTLKKSYLEKRAAFEKKDIKFKKERDNILRQTSIKKLSSLLAPDGILNQLKRLEPLKARFGNDFNEAYQRLKAVEFGVKNIFGYSVALPKEADSKNTNFFDDCLDWTRNAINFVNRFQQSEIHGIVPISIRNKSNTYDEFLDSYDSGLWSIILDQNDFKNKFCIRLKAVSLSITCLGANYREPFNMDGCFSAKIKAPNCVNNKDMEFIQLDGSNSKLSLKDFPKVSEVIIGRVFSNEFSRNPEVVGTDILFNVSPLGQWQIELSPFSRNFYYERKNLNKPNKIKRQSIFKNNVVTENDEEQEGMVASDPNIPETLKTDYKAQAYQRFPKFMNTDFFDIQMDLHIAYKTKP